MANLRPLASNAGTIQEIGTDGTNRTDTGIALLREQGADPALVADGGQLYTKDDGSGNTELFYQDQGGSVEQLTGAAVGQQLAIPVTTAGLVSGRFVYQSAAADETALHTDAADISTAKAIGAYEGVGGLVTIAGVIGDATFTSTAGVARGDPVYLALASEDVGTGAGKLRGTPPSGSGEVIAEVGIALATIAASGTGKVLIQVKSPVIILA